MKLISENDLVKGETYYIEAISKFNQMSGKKIGIFDGFEYPFGNHIPFAKFIQLRDLPNATMPTGMGSYNVNNTVLYIINSIYLKKIEYSKIIT